MFIVVSQQQEFASQWARVLEKRGNVHYVDGLVAAQRLLLCQPARLVVLDFCIARENPLALIQDLRRYCGEARLLLGATSFEPQRELAALAAGVAGCCDSALLHDDLERIVDIVLQGGVWVSRAAIPLLVVKLQEFSGRHGQDADALAPAPEPLHELTQRQREVAEMVSRGANNKMIAHALNISDRTVKAHLTTIFEKLGVTDRLHLALYINNRDKKAI